MTLSNAHCFLAKCQPWNIYEQFITDDAVQTIVNCIKSYTKARQKKNQDMRAFRSIGGVDNLTVDHLRAWIGILLARWIVESWK